MAPEYRHSVWATYNEGGEGCAIAAESNSILRFVEIGRKGNG